MCVKVLPGHGRLGDDIDLARGRVPTHMPRIDIVPVHLAHRPAFGHIHPPVYIRVMARAWLILVTKDAGIHASKREVSRDFFSILTFILRNERRSINEVVAGMEARVEKVLVSLETKLWMPSVLPENEHHEAGDVRELVIPGPVLHRESPQAKNPDEIAEQECIRNVWQILHFPDFLLDRSGLIMLGPALDSLALKEIPIVVIRI